MSETFGAVYAELYDLLYRDKDYDAEVSMLERLFEQHGLAGDRVLDLGCGTGQHAIRLARRGYRVTGVDRSASMLAIARVKAEQQLDELAPMPVFVEADVGAVRVGEGFDAVLMMFAVLGYQVTPAAVLASLRTARAHLCEGGLFVCDLWYGPAVLKLRPSARTKVVDVPDGRIMRSACATLHGAAQRVDVVYHVRRMRDREVVADLSETHRMRYFFPDELRATMEQAGFELLELKAFGDRDMPPSEESWNVLAVGKARVSAP
jgi:SAM-dependent methyltransferase